MARRGLVDHPLDDLTAQGLGAAHLGHGHGAVPQEQVQHRPHANGQPVHRRVGVR
jgi:hypothetical protein